MNLDIISAVTVRQTGLTWVCVLTILSTVRIRLRRDLIYYTHVDVTISL
jgi:hypothetical protein